MRLAQVLILAAVWPPFAREHEAPPRPLAGAVVLGGSAESQAGVRAFEQLVDERRSGHFGHGVVLLALDGHARGPAGLAARVRLVADARDLSDAGGVWLADASAEAWRASLARDAAPAAALRALVANGGVVGARGPVAALLGADGAGVVPDLLVRTSAAAEATAEPGPFPTLAIGPGAAAMVVDRRVVAAAAPERDGDAAGDNELRLPDVELRLPGASARDEAPYGTRIRRDGRSVFDRLAFVRAAREASRGDLDPLAAVAPLANGGALLLAGGGALPEDLAGRFLAEAGGPGARVVVLGARAEASDPRSPFARALAERGANLAHVDRLDGAALGRAGAEASELRTQLAGASGVWIEGGRAFALVDAYLDGPVPALLAEVLARGGVVGGTSAGASFVGAVLARGGPFDNREPLVAGYSRGLGLLPGCAVDSHVGERRRFGDLLALKRARPEALVIGLDEGTGLLVRAHRDDAASNALVGEVLGRGAATLLGGSAAPRSPEEAEIAHVAAGGRYDLTHRRPVGERR